MEICVMKRESHRKCVNRAPLQSFDRCVLLGSITNRCTGKEPVVLPERGPDSRESGERERGERRNLSLSFFVRSSSPSRPRESNDNATESSYLRKLKTEQQPFRTLFPWCL